MNPDGTGATQLTFNTAFDFLPDWQPRPSRDTVGVFRPSTGLWLPRKTNTAGPPDITLGFGKQGDIAFNFGQAGDLPVVGDWDGPNDPPNSGVNDPAQGLSRTGQPQAFTTTCSDPDGWHDISTIDFMIRRSEGQGNGVPLVLWVQFDEGPT